VQRREPAHVLQVERVHEQEAAERRGQTHRDRAGPGERGAGEEAHLEQRFATAQCLQIINRKVGVYEQHLADGTAQHLYTAEA
jgi:hypothetical protein